MAQSTTTPPHLRTDHCFVCGQSKHVDGTSRGGHRFWSNADAQSEARATDRRTTVSYSSGATTPEAAYVAQHRPY